VNLVCTNRSDPSIAVEYATRDDFQTFFTEGLVGLYLLSYLLTGSLEKAEGCFVTGIEDDVKSNSVFKEWARSWTRRAIAQNAIRMMAPRPNHSARRIGSLDLVDKPEGTQEIDVAIATVLALEDFERFVFILSVLERYSDQDCSLASKLFTRRSRAGTNASFTANLKDPHRNTGSGAGSHGNCLSLNRN
jgi:hypothetical protein